MRSLLVLLLWVGGAHAGDADVEISRRHFKIGKMLFEVGETAKAAREFDAAFRAQRLPLLVLNAATAYRKAGELEMALKRYRQFVQMSPDSRERTFAAEAVIELEGLTSADKQESQATKPEPKAVAKPELAAKPAKPEPVAKPELAAKPAKPEPVAKPEIVAKPDPVQAVSSGSVSFQVAEKAAPSRSRNRAWIWGVGGAALALGATAVGLGVGLSMRSTVQSDWPVGGQP